MPIPPHDPNSLESRLRLQRPRSAAPVDLHDSIVNAVRSAPPHAPASRWPLRLGALAVIGLAAVALWRISVPRSHEPAPVATLALVEQTQQSAQDASALLLNPLTQELDALSRDLTNASKVVRAAMPLDQSF